jgi:2-oxoglutarate ferredoxin oxidoreductase subunit beta
MATLADFNSPLLPTWCPGCGNFAIWTCLKQALVEKGLGPMDVNLCFDIGCNGNGADKINAYAFKGLHGRTIPLASGISLGNHKLPVIGIGGDGGTFDEGMGHLIHAIRSNYKFLFILHNNCDFGLTTGQATPTTPQGQKMNSSPYGVVESRLNPGQLVLASGASFYARGFTGNIPQLKELIVKGLEHEGFAFLEVLQHCPTYNKFQDHLYLNSRVYDVKTDADHKNDRRYVYDLVDYSNEKIATGLLYQDPESTSYYSRLEKRKGMETTLKDEVKVYDIAEQVKEFI